MTLQRRTVLQAMAAGALSACASPPGGMGFGKRRPRVLVVGGGYAGATAARYLRLWGGDAVQVSLLTPELFTSCPLSNHVLSGSLQLADLQQDYLGLVARGIEWIPQTASALDLARRRVLLADGQTLGYERLILAPGIDFLYHDVQGLSAGLLHAHILHAWKAGPQTAQLRAQLQAMPDGGVFVMTVPLAPYRCPPGPYERACLVAHYFRQHKPKSKVLVLDANPDLTSKGALFRRVWAQHYAGIIEYQPRFSLSQVDAGTLQVQSEFGDRVQADVLNVIPNQAAAALLREAGLANLNGRWCEVDFLSYESKVAPGVHVLGDAIQVAPQMPKSAHMANQQAKVCAAAVLDLLAGRELNRQPLLTNTCYSFIDPQQAIHVASVHAYDAQQRTMLPVPGAGGLSAQESALEGHYALQWARNIRADTLG